MVIFDPIVPNQSRVGNEPKSARIKCVSIKCQTIKPCSTTITTQDRKRCLYMIMNGRMYFLIYSVHFSYSNFASILSISALWFSPQVNFWAFQFLIIWPSAFGLTYQCNPNSWESLKDLFTKEDLRNVHCEQNNIICCRINQLDI